MFEKIMKWHKQGLWTEKMVNDAVTKCIITEEQAKEILKRGEE